MDSTARAGPGLQDHTHTGKQGAAMTKLEILPTKRARAFALTVFLLAAFALPASGATAAPSLLTQFCETGSGAGQCDTPQGIATDPTSGNVYVAGNRGCRPRP